MRLWGLDRNSARRDETTRSPDIHNTVLKFGTPVLFSGQSTSSGTVCPAHGVFNTLGSVSRTLGRVPKTCRGVPNALGEGGRSRVVSPLHPAVFFSCQLPCRLSTLGSEQAKLAVQLTTKLTVCERGINTGLSSLWIAPLSGKEQRPSWQDTGCGFVWGLTCTLSSR